MLFLAHVSLALFMSCVHQVFSPQGQGYKENLWIVFNSYKHETSKKAAPNDSQFQTRSWIS